MAVPPILPVAAPATHTAKAQSRKIEDFRPGYPRFTSLISSHDSFFLFRRFSRLRARLLLIKQDRLAVLEQKLDDIDNAETIPIFLGKARIDRNQDRLSVLAEIESTLAEYDNLVDRTERTLSFGRSEIRDVQSLRNWVDGNGCVARDETSYLSDEKDLFSLSPTLDSAATRFEDWIEDRMAQFFCHRKLGILGRDVSSDPNVHIYSGTFIKRTAKAFMICLVTMLLLLPIVICNLVNALATRLLIVMLSTVVYLLVLSGLTRVKTIELVVAGTTYATVLTVFITLVAPLKQDYETAKLFLEDKACEYSLKASGALCTLGKIGPHHFILAGSNENDLNTALFVNDTVNDLLTEFPSIRVGFLIGVNAVAPTEGLAKIGDIVVGTPQGLEPGLVQFDTRQTTHLNRLSVTHQMSPPPSVVHYAVDSLRSRSGRLEFRNGLLESAMAICRSDTDQANLGWSDSVKVLHGKIASSQSNPPKDDVLNRAGRDSKVLCFERAAAKLKPQIPFLTVCGITQTTNGFENTLKRRRAGMAAIVYAMLIAGKIDLQKLERQHTFTDLFVYEPFDLERPGFRLIRLKQGTQLPLKCYLIQAYLDKESVFDYEALSYVWGSQSTPCEVMVDDKFMSITTSLYDALCHLRKSDEDLILWVDGLCIDQSNTKERSHQVNHMSEIYRKADNVIIWLGYLGGNATLLKTVADQFAKQIPSQAFRKWSREDSRWRDQWCEAEKSLGIFDTNNLVNGLSTFLENSWFTRIWILQEVANAKRAIIQCNLGEIPAKIFAILPHVIGCSVSDQCQAVLDIMPGLSSTTSWWSRDRNLCTLLYKFRGSEASDPRDRVYGLLGMASDRAESMIEADYSKEEEMVVQDFVTKGALIKAMSVKNGNLGLILDTPGFVFDFDDEPYTALTTKESQTLKNLHDWHFKLLASEKRIRPKRLLFSSRIRTVDSTDVGTDDRTIFFQAATNGPRMLRFFMDNFPSRTNKSKTVINDLTVSYAVNHDVAKLEVMLKALPQIIELDQLLFAHALKEGPNVLRMLFKCCARPINITEDMSRLAVGAGIPFLEMIYDNWATDMEITELVTEKAAIAGMQTLTYLIDNSESKIQITQHIVEKSRTSGSGYSMLLELQETERDVTEDEAIQAIRSGPE
ncbi:hypothetical protein ACLX1H_006047 [Fusarium chlamydosporum]